MHLEAEHIQRLLHHELGRLDGRVMSHLAECQQCRHAVEQAREEEEGIFALLRRLDHPPPAVTADELLARPRRAMIWGRRAAGLVLALGIAGAAYAAPGSPFRGWLDSAVERLAGRSSTPEPSEAPPEAPSIAGIAVVPSRRFTIAFAENQAHGVATVSLTDGREVTVRAKNGSATFTSGANRLSINNQGSTADYEIELPRSAMRIEILAGSRLLLLQENGRVTGPAEADSSGRYRLDLAPPR